MATKFELYSATHKSVTVARGQRKGNTDRVKNQSDCRIRYRAVLRKSLCKRKDPITGNSFIRVMIINNWMVLIDRESLHTPGT